MSPWRGSGPSTCIADGVDSPSCITSRYVPTEKLQLRVRSSRRRKALLQLFLALGERCTDGATSTCIADGVDSPSCITSRNGYRDRDRGRPVLLVRPVRVVSVTSSNLAILKFFFVAAECATAFRKTAAWSCVERSSGRRRRRSEFFFRRPYLTSRRRRSRDAPLPDRRRPANEPTC